jgi:hypothetical protein
MKSSNYSLGMRNVKLTITAHNEMVTTTRNASARNLMKTNFVLIINKPDLLLDLNYLKMFCVSVVSSRVNYHESGSNGVFKHTVLPK